MDRETANQRRVLTRRLQDRIERDDDRRGEQKNSGQQGDTMLPANSSPNRGKETRSR